MGSFCSRKQPNEWSDRPKRGFKFWKWRKAKPKPVEISLDLFDLLPLEMHNAIFMKMDQNDRLKCRLLSSKFRFYVDSLYKFSITLTDENVSDFCSTGGYRFLSPESLRIGDLFHKTVPKDLHQYFPSMVSLHFISRTSRTNAQSLLSGFPSVRELHLHSSFLAGAKNLFREPDDILTVFQNLTILHLTIQFIPPTLGQDLRVSILQNNLDDVLRYNFPALETIHVKIVAGAFGEQFYFSFKRLCGLLERHKATLSTVYLEAPSLKPINVSSDMELPIIYILLSRCHPEITFHITIGDSEQKTFAAQDYDNRAEFLGDLTEAAVKRHDKKLLGTLFNAFTDAEPILTYDF